MEEESFIGAFGDVPTDLAGDHSQLFIFRTEDFDAWYRRVRDAYNREVGSLRDETYVDTMSDADLAEHGLVRIPVDADGVPIHVGDVMEWPYGNGEFIVEGIGRDVLFYIDQDSNECEWTAARNKRHHHEPTVEDVLREFAEKMAENTAMYVAESWDADERDEADAAAIAEYAAKLRLAEEDE